MTSKTIIFNENRCLSYEEILAKLGSKLPNQLLSYIQGFVPQTIFVVKSLGVVDTITVKVQYDASFKIRGHFKVDISFPCDFYFKARLQIQGISIDNYYLKKSMADCIAAFRGQQFSSNVKLTYTNQPRQKGASSSFGPIFNAIPTHLISNDCAAYFNFDKDKKNVYHIKYLCYYGGINYLFQMGTKILEVMPQLLRCNCNLSSSLIKVEDEHLFMKFSVIVQKSFLSAKDKDDYFRICERGLAAIENKLKPYANHAGSSFSIENINLTRVNYEEANYVADVLDFTCEFSLPK